MTVWNWKQFKLGLFFYGLFFFLISEVFGTAECFFLWDCVFALSKHSGWYWQSLWNYPLLESSKSVRISINQRRQTGQVFTRNLSQETPFTFLVIQSAFCNITASREALRFTGRFTVLEWERHVGARNCWFSFLMLASKPYICFKFHFFWVLIPAPLSYANVAICGLVGWTRSWSLYIQRQKKIKFTLSVHKGRMYRVGASRRLKGWGSVPWHHQKCS